jgi:hypothetical protein
MTQALSDYYRVPERLLGRVVVPDSSDDFGFFRFGPNVICYGQSASGVAKEVENAGCYDALRRVTINGSDICLPFDLTQVIENLRREHYVEAVALGRDSVLSREWMLKTYYFIRDVLPVSVRRQIQRVYFSDWKIRSFPMWPLDFTVDNLHS